VKELISEQKLKENAKLKVINEERRVKKTFGRFINRDENGTK
jgi:hypothetical protein